MASPHKYWLVMDFEATCESDDPRWQNEIIEFPCVMVFTSAPYEKVAEFQSFVRPTSRPTLTNFCKNLTSIKQADVDSAPPLSSVLSSFDAFLQTHGCSEGNVLPIFCGDWDVSECLLNECARKGIDGLVPPILSSWCNTKLIYQRVTGERKRKGMDGMLNSLGLELDGTHHRGIDDSRNIAQIIRSLFAASGVGVIEETSRLGEGEKSICRSRNYARGQEPVQGDMNMNKECASCTTVEAGVREEISEVLKV